MPPMASSIHPDFRDDVTVAQARAADEKTERLFFEQQVAKRAGDMDRYLQLAQEMLQTRLGVYKPDSMPVGDAWCLIGSAYRRESKLQEAIEATEKSIEIHAAGDNEDNFVLAREQFCLILEDMEKLSDAKEIRLRGARPKNRTYDDSNEFAAHLSGLGNDSPPKIEVIEFGIGKGQFFKENPGCSQTLIVTEEGDLGMTRHVDQVGLQAGDIVVNLFGYNVPFILRPLKGGEMHVMLNVAQFEAKMGQYPYDWIQFEGEGGEEYALV
ncbi:unnamed protein product [Alternaria alternata]